MEEDAHDVVIVGAGIAGLATALGLHRLGVRSVVLESSGELRSSGFALVTWRNAWRALDVLGVADVLRAQHVPLDGTITKSLVTGATTAEMRFNVPGLPGYGEVRCLRRNLILEALEQGLPRGTVRLGAKVVSIEEHDDGDCIKLLHLADGSTIKAKALVGCDGVNSYVAKWLGLKSPTQAGRSAARAITEFTDGHGFEHAFHQFNGDGFRSGFLPCDDKHIYWFFTWYPSSKEQTVTPAELKQYVLSRIATKLPSKVVAVVERTNPEDILASPLRFRFPLDVIWGPTHKDNVCVAGDAFHAMTPDIGQGGCAALEDGVVLARCLGEAFLAPKDAKLELEHERIRMAVDKYVKERKWRCFKLIVTAYIIGATQQRDGALMNFVRDKGLSSIMIRRLLGITDYNVGSLAFPHRN